MRSKIGAIVLVGLLAFTGTGGASAQVESQVDVKPNWRKRPTPGDLLAVWPREALQRGRGGKAVIHCKVSVQGALYECIVVSESPKDSGFGQAALTLATQFLMSPAQKGGHAVAFDGVSIPINFQAPEAETGSHLAGMGPYSGKAFQDVSGVPWLNAPSVGEVAAAYPPRGRAKTLEGHVALDCTFRADGHLTSCDVISEDPKGMGFGDAARSLTGKFVGPTTLPGGRNIARAHVQLPISFPLDTQATSPLLSGKVSWTATPRPEDFATTLGPIAKAAGVAVVRATLECVVGPTGGLTQCAPISEEPAGQGVGAAMTGLAQQFAMVLWTDQGLATVGGRMRLPLRWNAPAAPRPPMK